SSRRRHTRFSRDWSSDVCSSDLSQATPLPTLATLRPMPHPLLPPLLSITLTRAGKSAATVSMPKPVLRLLAARWASSSLRPLARSEDGRVGKEGGSRWARELGVG